MLRHSHLIISAHRAKSTDQKTVYFLRFSLTHLVAPFHRHIIIPLEHINAIGITGQISLPYVLIKREKQRVVFQLTFPKRHKQLPGTAGLLFFLFETVLLQLHICLGKHCSLYNFKIPGLVRAG